jgi:hypothetical protein
MNVYLSRGKSIDIPNGYYERKELAAQMREVLNPYAHSMFGRYRKSSYDSYDGMVDRQDAEKVLKILGNV